MNQLRAIYPMKFDHSRIPEWILEYLNCFNDHDVYEQVNTEIKSQIIWQAYEVLHPRLSTDGVLSLMKGPA